MLKAANLQLQTSLIDFDDSQLTTVEQDEQLARRLDAEWNGVSGRTLSSTYEPSPQPNLGELIVVVMNPELPSTHLPAVKTLEISYVIPVKNMELVGVIATFATSFSAMIAGKYHQSTKKKAPGIRRRPSRED